MFLLKPQELESGPGSSSRIAGDGQEFFLIVLFKELIDPTTCPLIIPGGTEADHRNPPFVGEDGAVIRTSTGDADDPQSNIISFFDTRPHPTNNAMPQAQCAF